MKPLPFPLLLLALALVQPAPAAPAPKLFTEGVRATEPLTPEQQQKTFHLPPGFKIQLVAAEPDLRKPMNMAFDSAGRLWVTESREYPFAATNAALARDTIRIFSDFDDNGRARKVTTFATNLNIPIGLYPFRAPRGSGQRSADSSQTNAVPPQPSGADRRPLNADSFVWKCLVWSIPNIYLLEDTDGDGIADKKELLYGPFDHTRDTHGNQASFRRGMDGWIYATHGFNNQSHVSGRDGHEIFLPSGNIYRFRLDGSRLEHWTHGQVNPFGLTFDPLGNLYSADCHSSPIYQLLRGAHYPSFGRPHDGLGFGPTTIQHSHGSTAICGIVHISDPSWPAEFQGNIIIGNVMTSRINRDQLEWRGSTSVGHELPDFLSTDDPWFRPVDLQFGPDGALWVADFYNRIIGHYEVPLLHPGRDRERGRLWRIVPPVGADVRRLKLIADPKSETPHVVPYPRDALLNHLLSQNPTRRALAREELALLPNANKDGLLTQAATGGWHFRQGDSRDGLLTTCLWLLNRAGTLEDKTLLTALADRDEPIRVHALRILTERGLQAAAQRENPARPASLPLPAGEGRGEGENSRSPAASSRQSPLTRNLTLNPSPSPAAVAPVLPHPSPLPLGEGTGSTALGFDGTDLTAGRLGATRGRPASLPLPAGEGRGEGESSRSPKASARPSPPAPNLNANPAPSPAAIVAILPHPSPLPLGEGTRLAAAVGSQPSQTSVVSAALLAATRTALADPSAHVQRAAADALAANPHADNLAPLLALQKRAPAEDTHLAHVVRLALREQLRLPGTFRKLTGQQLPEVIARSFASVALALTNAEAATFLVRHVETQTEPADALARYVTHAARYAPDADLPKLAKLGRKQFATDLDAQAALFKAMHDGLTVRGGALPPDLRAWGTDLAGQLLAAAPPQATWTYVPLNAAQPGRNPFAFEERTCTDGQKARLMSSLPHGETLTGILRSPVFVLPKQLSFYLCGHDGVPQQPAGGKNHVRLRLVEDTKKAEGKGEGKSVAADEAFSLRAARGEGGRRPDEGWGGLRSDVHPSPQPSPLLRGREREPDQVVAANEQSATLPHPGPLPLGEGTGSTALGSDGADLTFGRLDKSPWRTASPPLPAGEGRGEGESVGSPAASSRQSPLALNPNLNPAPRPAAVAPVLPHPGPLPLGEGTGSTALGSDGAELVAVWLEDGFLRVGEPLLRVGEPLLRIGEPLLRIGEPLLRIGKSFLRVPEPFLRLDEVLLRVPDGLLRRRNDFSMRRNDFPIRLDASPTGQCANLAQMQEAASRLDEFTSRLSATELCLNPSATHSSLVPLRLAAAPAGGGLPAGVVREAKVPRNDMAQKITWDLADVAGKRAVIEVTDGDEGKAYAWLAFGRFAPALPELALNDTGSSGKRQQAGADLARSLKLTTLEPAVAKLFAESTEASVRASAGRAWLALNAVAALTQVEPLVRDAAQPEALRAELAAQLGEAAEARGLAVVVAALTNAPSRLQTKFAAVLVGTAAGTEQLLAAAEAGRVPARLLQDRTLADRLGASPARDAKGRHAALVKNLPPADAQLQKQIEAKRAEFKPQQASAARGAEVFTKACAVCHQLAGQGALVGPQLDGIGGRGLERLLEDILDPNRNVDKAFRTTVFVLKDGETVSGLQRREEGGAFIYALANGQEARVAKADVKERRETETSLMPANFIEALPAGELNDLLAFLLGQKGK